MKPLADFYLRLIHISPWLCNKDYLLISFTHNYHKSLQVFIIVWLSFFKLDKNKVCLTILWNLYLKFITSLAEAAVFCNSRTPPSTTKQATVFRCVCWYWWGFCQESQWECIHLGNHHVPKPGASRLALRCLFFYCCSTVKLLNSWDFFEVMREIHNAPFGKFLE